MVANLSFDKQRPPLDVEAVRRDFPILATNVHGYPLAYLDSAASSQPALPVLRAVEQYETHSHANVHRGVHALSQAATAAFEGARERVRRFINAASVKEIIFVRGTTEGINLVAQSYARPRLRPGDEILITGLEHHANIVPWQMACEQTGARQLAGGGDQPPRRGPLRGVPAPAFAAHARRRLRPRIQRTRHRAAGEAHDRRRACARRRGADRWSAGGAAFAGRHARVERR